jgi:hypothetical protein
MKVWLDDWRAEPEGWVRTTTVEETIELLKTDEVDEISLDNDLGLGFLEGYKVMDWMERELAENGRMPPTKIHIHTGNPSARKVMEAGLKSINKMLEAL